MTANTLSYLLVALAILLLVALALAIYAGARMWQQRERAKDDLHPTYRPSKR